MTRLAFRLLKGAKSVSEFYKIEAWTKIVVIVRLMVRMKSHLSRVWATDMQSGRSGNAGNAVGEMIDKI